MAAPGWCPNANAPIRDAEKINVKFCLMFSQFLRIVTGVEKGFSCFDKTTQLQIKCVSQKAFLECPCSASFITVIFISCSCFFLASSN